MSSMIRRIQRANAVDTEGKIKRKSGNRSGNLWGDRLGVTNPKDPCRTGKRKPPKAWRAKDHAPAAKPALVPATVDIERAKPCNRPWKGFSLADLALEHRFKMQRKARQRTSDAQSGNEPGRVARLLGIPAGINRHTGRPHENKREIARQGGGQ